MHRVAGCAIVMRPQKARPVETEFIQQIVHAGLRYAVRIELIRPVVCVIVIRNAVLFENAVIHEMPLHVPIDHLGILGDVLIRLHRRVDIHRRAERVMADRFETGRKPRHIAAVILGDQRACLDHARVAVRSVYANIARLKIVERLLHIRNRIHMDPPRFALGVSGDLRNVSGLPFRIRHDIASVDPLIPVQEAFGAAEELQRFRIGIREILSCDLEPFVACNKECASVYLDRARILAGRRDAQRMDADQEIFEPHEIRQRFAPVNRIGRAQVVRSGRFAQRNGFLIRIRSVLRSVRARNGYGNRVDRGARKDRSADRIRLAELQQYAVLRHRISGIRSERKHRRRSSA